MWKVNKNDKESSTDNFFSEKCEKFADGWTVDMDNRLFKESSQELVNFWITGSSSAIKTTG